MSFAGLSFDFRFFCVFSLVNVNVYVNSRFV